MSFAGRSGDLRPEQVKASLPPALGKGASALLTLSSGRQATVTLQSRASGRDVTIENIACRLLLSPRPSGAKGLKERVAQSFSCEKIVVELGDKPLILLLDSGSLKKAGQQGDQKALAKQITGKGMQEAVKNVEAGERWVWTQEDEMEEVRRRAEDQEGLPGEAEVAQHCFQGDSAEAVARPYETAEEVNAVYLRTLRGKQAVVEKEREGERTFPGGRVTIWDETSKVIGRGGFNTVLQAPVWSRQGSVEEGALRVHHEENPTEEAEALEPLPGTLKEANEQAEACVTLLRKAGARFPAAEAVASPKEPIIDPLKEATDLLERSKEGRELAQTAVLLIDEWIGTDQRPKKGFPEGTQPEEVKRRQVWIQDIHGNVKSCLAKTLQVFAEVTGGLEQLMGFVISSTRPDDAERLFRSAARARQVAENLKAEMLSLQIAVGKTEEAMQFLAEEEKAMDNTEAAGVYAEEAQMAHQLGRHLGDLDEALRSTVHRIRSVEESLGKNVEKTEVAAVYKVLEGIPGLVMPKPLSYLDEAGRTRRVEVAPLYNQGSLLKARYGMYRAGVVPEVARQCVAQVASMHARGVVHLDLKPDNIVVNKEEENWNAAVIDFDMAALCDRQNRYIEKEKGYTEEEKIYARGGTRGYFPLEAFIISPQGKKTLKSWITAEGAKQRDAWSLGLTLYEALLGQRSAAEGDKYDITVKTVDEQLARLEGQSHPSSTVFLNVERTYLRTLTERVALALMHPNPIKRLTTQEADAILSGRIQDYKGVIAGALKRETVEDLKRALAPLSAQKPRREERQE